jgi:uncharacterized protein YndB with AHSA1/START domain
MTVAATAARGLLRGVPIEIDMAETMPGPPEIVWELITDWEHQDDWMLEASNFRVTSERREGVGVEAEATIRMGGLTTRDRVRVAAWQPGRLLAIEHRGWVSGRGEIYLTPLGRGLTHVFWREVLEPPLGIVGTAGLWVFRPWMGRVFRRDLRVLAALVRARTRHPS